ncbi:trihelix transcription factor ASR3-like isoform X2 [Panicum virgatum]|uniref:trihelix transcription factor ASR3-like isoform X2 n=1 Tax=Panicum virgatum TaxID=38727 RepID=UPI0019D59BE3|nr:trihelix transcription factor ASR3-like isoform X2 [Panicum virgatum]
MDPTAADLPCVIQALPAHSKAVPPPPLVQALPAHHSPAKTHPPPAAAAADAASSPAAAKRRPPPATPGPAPPSPRRTRSGGAPEWTPAETLALVAEVAAVDDGWSRSVSTFQKWAMVAENLAASEALASSGPARRRGSKRAAAECRRRWEALAAEHRAVRRWEVRTGGRYWEMGAAARRKAGLPVEFDVEVYGAMDALIRVEEALLAGAAAGGGDEVEGLVGSGAGVEVGEQDGGDYREVGEDDVQEDEAVEEAKEEEEEVVEVEEEEEEEDDEEDNEEQEEMQMDDGNPDASNDLGHEMGTNSEPVKSQNNAWDLANKLQENAQHIHTILKHETDEDAGQNHALAGLVSPDAMATTRQKADELIKSLGGLVSYLNQFTELVKENGFENIVGMT